MKKPAKPRRKSYIRKDGAAKELDGEFFQTAQRGRPPMLQKDRKQRVTIMLDPAVISHFKKDGRGWQTRINEALTKAVKSRRA